MKKIPCFLLGLAAFVSSGPAQTAAKAGAVTQLDTVVVTASPLPRSAFDLAQPVSVLDGDALQLKLQPTLGDTLNGEPGIAASHFTNGASRPIIRGLTDNRVLILQNGTDIFDVSNLSPDHTPSVEPLSRRIDVVRGPATILYGSSAIGGVVNVIDNRIPTQALSKMFNMELDSRYGSADTEFGNAFSIDFMPVQHLVLHVDGSLLTTNDVHIPGYALTPAIQRGLSPEQKARGNAFGGNPKFLVPNARVNTKDIGFGGSYVWDRASSDFPSANTRATTACRTTRRWTIPSRCPIRCTSPRPSSATTSTPACRIRSRISRTRT